MAQHRCTLGSFVIFQGIRTSIAKKPYNLLCDFWGLGSGLPRPSGSVHALAQMGTDWTMLYLGISTCLQRFHFNMLSLLWDPLYSRSMYEDNVLLITNLALKIKKMCVSLGFYPYQSKSKRKAETRNHYKQVPHLSQDTVWKNDKTQET